MSAHLLTFIAFTSDLMDSARSLVATWEPAHAFVWPYLAGSATLAVGLPGAIRREIHRTSALDRVVLLGPVLFAIPMAVFGVEHFAFANEIASMIPIWIPWHLFWAYFVGTALIAAALSIATGVQARLSATLLGIMLFLFVLLLDVPRYLAMPHDRIRLTIVLRDLALSSGAFALATSTVERNAAARTLLPVARNIVALAALIFGTNHFLFPEAAPGIPQQDPTIFMTMPGWIPNHALWAYVTGTIFLLCGFGMLFARWARPAATILGLALLFVMLCVYLPPVLTGPMDTGNALGYLGIHSALAGATLLVAGAMP